MADNISGRAERPDFHDNDPFAELTRIMGHDPRQDQRRNDDHDLDLALDLENELLGDLDLSSEEETEALAGPAPQRDDVPEPEWAELVQEEPFTRHAETASAEEAVGEAAPDDMAAELDFAEFDAELGAAFETGLDDEPAFSEDHHPAVAEEPVEAATDWSEPDQRADAQLEASGQDDDDVADWQAEDWQPAEAAPVGEEHDGWSGAGAAAADWEIGEGSVDQPSSVHAVGEPEQTAFSDEAAIEAFEFDEELLKSLDDEPATVEDEHPPLDEVSAYADESPAQVEAVAPKTFEPVPEVSEIPQVSDQLSLEEELTMLLAGTERLRVEPAAAFAAAAAPRPAVPSLQEAAPAMARQSWPSRPAPAAGREIPEIETVEMSGFEPIRSAEFEVPDLPVEEQVQAASEFDDITAEFSRAFEAGELQDRADEPSYQGAYATPDQPQPRQSDLDWAAVTAVPQAGAALRSDGHGTTENDYFDDASYQGGFEGAGAAAGLSAYRHDDDLADEMATDRPVLRDNRRRNMMVAGGALALVLLGGVGVFALWSGGGSGGEPVLLQADGEPVRVRPEEPGGTVVPNQDSEVYQRVAGGREEAEPSQDRLIDTAEEPIDLTVQNAPRIVGPGADENAGFGSDLSAVKVEERLEAGGEETAANANDDIVALQPRRVRTMVVRPDGSIVPREDPAPAAAPSTESAPAASAPQTLTPSPNAAAEAQTPAAAPESAAEAATDMPEEIALAPATRPATAEQPPAAATPPAPAPAPVQAPQQEQQVAAVSPTPAAPQATQTSEWSMQIASQPSSESAQATYQDLARRYSSLLEGRGVNIIRAEVDGRTFYRVRIPMATRDEAVNLCTRYQQAGGSCFVSR